jgi:antitoxin FitA
VPTDPNVRFQPAVPHFIAGRKYDTRSASIASNNPREWNVAAVSIRDLDDSVKEKLRIRAARHGRSMEAEMRAILTAAVTDEDTRTDLFAALVDRFARVGGVELDLPARATPARAASLLE